MGDRQQPAIVVVGAGAAGIACVRSIRRHAPDRPVMVIGDEAETPYDRTQLTKPGILDAELWKPRPILGPDDELSCEIVLRLGVRASAIDTASRHLVLDGATAVPFGGLVLATGARPRALPMLPANARNVLAIRTVRDVQELRAALAIGTRVAIVGGGVISLELAAVAAAAGADIAVIEAGPEVLGRYAPAVIGARIRKVHEDRGVQFFLGQRPVAVTSRVDRVESLRLTSGAIIATDLVVVAIGIVPNDELASSSGIAVDDGIVVDARGRTSTPGIWAAGDVASWPPASGIRGGRQESWQGAIDAGERVAADVLGLDPGPTAVPFTSSEQAGHVLQVVGSRAVGQTALAIAEPDGGRLLVLEANAATNVIESAAGLSEGTSIGKVLSAARMLIAANATLDLESLARVDFGEAAQIIAQLARDRGTS